MSISAIGSVSYTTTEPNIQMHVTGIDTDDALLGWESDTVLSLVYVQSNDWSTVSSVKSTTNVPQLTKIGTPRNYNDMFNNAIKWTFWPYVSNNTDVTVLLTELDGVSDTVQSTANYTYTNVIDINANEVVTKLQPTRSGVLAIIRVSDPSYGYQLRAFSYPDSIFANTSSSIHTTATATVSNYTSILNIRSAIDITRDAFYSVSIDSNTGTLRYVAASVTEDSGNVTFTTIANTTTGMPNATRVWWTKYTPKDDTVLNIFDDDDNPRMLFVKANGSNPTSDSLGIVLNGNVYGSKLTFCETTNTYFYYSSSMRLVAEADTSLMRLVNLTTDFVMDGATLCTLFDIPVFVGGIEGSAEVYAVNAGNGFGQRLNIGTAGGVFAPYGVNIVQTPFGSDVFEFQWTSPNAGDSHTIRNYQLTEYPRGNAWYVASGYENPSSIGSVYYSMGILPNGRFAAVNSLNQLGTLDYDGTFTQHATLSGNSLYQIGVSSTGTTYHSIPTDLGGNNYQASLYSVEAGSSTVTQVVANAGIITSGSTPAGMTYVLPDGLVLWTVSNTNTYVYTYNVPENINTELTGVVIPNATVTGASNMSNTNTLFMCTGQTTSSVVEISVVETGSVVQTTPLASKYVGLSMYNSDKFVTTPMTLGTNVYAIYTTPSSVSVTEIVVNGNVDWGGAYGIFPGIDGNMYVNTFTRDIVRIEPVL